MSGNLFIVCAPSGGGKTSLVAELLKADPRVKLSISYTTRPPRPGEAHARDYHFVSEEQFRKLVEQDELLEHALVHGHCYGTSRSWVAERRDAGDDILLEIDWQGAAQIRKLIPEAVGIFILPPSFETLVARLNKRAQDAPDVIARRLAAAREEIGHAGEFDYVIINSDFEEAVRDLIAIVRAERLRSDAQLARHHPPTNRMK
ncbi:MAG TPA: guanylate kinase [Burkholderiales bacterium]|nr:guanylate kinase [Burkholderiales bacterium]